MQLRRKLAKKTGLCLLQTGHRITPRGKRIFAPSIILPRQGEVAPKATEGEDGDQLSNLSRRSSAIVMISRTTPSRFDNTSLAG